MWAVALAVMVIGDAAMLTAVIAPFVEARVGDLMLTAPRLDAAAFFYVLYPLGIVHFAAMPGLRAGSPAVAAGQGVLAGLFAYGTYEATNLATLIGWEWSMVALDMAWGAVLTAAAAALAAWAGLRVAKAR
ncbi:MAG: putative membrane protein [Paracoccaceae bacterium]|jgi:uncharacterized membrane protein